jgi:dephospho-CoA kinase
MAEKISSRPFSIALTGGIGSGKSTVGAIFKELGAYVMDSDHIVHTLLGPDSSLVEPIKKYFGKEVITDNNAINRKILGDIVFQSEEKRKWLEKLIHPRVYRRMWDLTERHKAPYYIMLIPLLFESHHENEFDRILTVDIPETLQIERVKQRSDYDEAKIRRVMAAQISRDERLIKSDDIIDNSGDMDDLKKQAKILHEKYLILAKLKHKKEKSNP